MSFAIIADAHLRGKDWEDKKVVLNNLKEDMASKGVRYLLNAGDLFDQGRIGDKYVSAGVICSWLSDWLYSQPHLALVSVEGNHDQTSTESAYSLFQHPQQVVIRNEVKWVGIEGHFFICIPWLTQNRVGCDPRAYVKEMIVHCHRDIMVKHPKAVKSVDVLGHIDAVGASIRSHVGITSEEYSRYTFDLDKIYSYSNQGEGVWIDNTFLGHIHAKQPVSVKAPGYHGYIGYLAPLGFGETANFNGWTYFDGEDVEFRNLHAPRYYHNVECGFYSNSWDHHRLSGENAERNAKVLAANGINPRNIEVISESLSLETVKEYIDAKDSTFKQVFDKWLEITGTHLEDRSLIDEYIESLNINWENLTGRLARWKSVELANIGPHTSMSQTFEDGFTAIVAPNGSGKSFLAESLPFACFGEWVTPRGNLSETMGKDSKVSAVLEIDDRDYTVVRTAKEMVVYDDDGKALTKELKRSSKAWLEQLIGDKDNFLHCCFLSQQGDYDIIKCDPSTRMHTLRYFLKLDVFDVYLKDIKDKLSNHKVNLQQNSNKVKNYDEVIFNIKELASAIKKSSIKINSINDKISELTSIINANIDDYDKAIERSNIENEIKILSNDIKNLNIRSMSYILDKDFVSNVEDIEDMLDKYEGELAKEKEIEARYKSLKVVMNGSSLDKAGCAPSHLQCPLIDKYVNAQKEINQLPQVEVFETKIEKLTRIIQGLEKELVSVKKTINSNNFIQSKIDDTKNQIQQKQERVDELTKELELLPITSTSVNVKNLTKEKDMLNAELIGLKYRSGQDDKELQSLKEELEVIKDNMSTIEDLKFKVNSFEVLEKAFGRYGLSHYLASSALPELQEIFNSLLQISFDGRLKIQFDNIVEKGKKLKESFSINKVNSRKVHDVRHCSGGEQAVLQMLWKLTLLIYQSHRNEGYRCLILDEPTAWMDSTNIESTVKLLKTVASRFDQIIMVTHDAELAEIADQKIVLG